MERIVVGDRVKQQFPQTQMIAISEVDEIIDGWVERSGTLTLHVGQGITYSHLERLYEAAKKNGNVKMVPPEISVKATRSLTHKHVPSNIVITPPLSRGDGTYVAQLIFDDDCADVSDHLTGQHIPGMLVAESARQMMIAVTEKFFVAEQVRSGVRFITDRMEIDYLAFLLPVPVEILYIPLSVRRAGENNLKLSCEIDFRQAGKSCVRACFNYSVINRHYLDSKEKELVDQMLKATLMQV
jgi:hypothetical protein